MRVHLLIIHYVILVIGQRRENRREIQGGDAEVLQVVQPLHNPLQIAAEKLACAGLRMRARALAPCARDSRLTVTVVLTAAYIIRWVAIVEAVGEYLVKHAGLRPDGMLVVRQDFEIAGIGGRVTCDAPG